MVVTRQPESTASVGAGPPKPPPTSSTFRPGPAAPRRARRSVAALPPPWNWSTGARTSGVSASRSAARAPRAARIASARFSRSQYAATAPVSCAGMSDCERGHAVEERQRVVQATRRHHRDPLHPQILHAPHHIEGGWLEGEDRDRQLIGLAARGLGSLAEIGDGGGQVVQQHVDRDPAVAVLHHARPALGGSPSEQDRRGPGPHRRSGGEATGGGVALLTGPRVCATAN